MGPDARRPAHEVVNTYSEAALVRVFKTYGEERASGRIARAICRRREEAPLTRTWELRDLVAEATRGGHLQKTLSRIFQAIRIEVNEELDHLHGALEQAVGALQPGGRIAVLSYHSLEDRSVKQVFREAAKGCICPPDLPVCGCGRKATLEILTPRGIRPGEDERARNPRARSAALRVGQRLPEGA
jgi:16S rRNA (cytosine1402-N4)-methyltransferase